MATLNINSIAKYQDNILAMRAKSLTDFRIEHEENMLEKLSSSFIETSLTDIKGIGSTKNTISSIAKTLSESISDISNSHVTTYKKLQEQADKAQSAMLSSLGKTSFDYLIADIPCRNTFNSRSMSLSTMGIEYKEDIWKNMSSLLVDTSANLNGICPTQKTIGSIDIQYESMLGSSAKSFSTFGIDEDMLKILSPSYKEDSIASLANLSSMQETIDFS